MLNASVDRFPSQMHVKLGIHCHQFLWGTVGGSDQDDDCRIAFHVVGREVAIGCND